MKGDKIGILLDVLGNILTVVGWIIIVLGLFFFQLPQEGHF